jgi:hypothetical protein
MSTPERADDPGEHGYGGVGKDPDEQDVTPATDDDEEEREDERRHVGGEGRGEGDGVDYPSTS